MIEQSALIIDATSKKAELTSVKDPEIFGPMDYGFREFNNPNPENFVVLGRGLLAGSSIPGTHRMIVVAYSRLWEQFYDSTMGGAAYMLLRLGVNYVHIKGKCNSPCILKINRKGNDMNVVFEPVPELEKIWQDYKGFLGFYGLQQYIFDNYAKDFDACRILATGPAALHTRAGALGSAPVEGGKLTAVDCWAGRGGLGSQLIQNHNIAGIIYGGDSIIRDPRLTNRQLIDKIFMDTFGKNMMQEDIAVTEKYRYEEKFHSGGTLGVNFTTLKGKMFSFNYRSVLMTELQRKDIHQRFVLDHYLKQFNEETIEPKKFKHCGEPCPVLCKKMNDEYKKDYEPYQTLGPNSGIFDQRAAEKANHYADAMGFDAIQIGIICSWIMDCLDSDVISKENLGLMRMPKFNPNNFDVVNDSMNNAELAIEIMDLVLKNEIFWEGMRNAAHRLAEKYENSIQHLAVYNSQGAEGCMVPNQYWDPGMYSPMPLMGKYCTSYGKDYMEPKEVGKLNVERMIRELYSDNGGLCRFHRKWIEKILPRLVNKLYNEKLNYYQHHKKLSQLINLHNKPVFWESEKTVDIIYGYLKRESAENPGAKAWVAKFDKDKWAAAKEYWQLILDGQNEAFR